MGIKSDGQSLRDGKNITNFILIYLIHSNLNVQKLLWPFIQESFNTDNLVLRNVVLTICIMLLCIAIDIILKNFLEPRTANNVFCLIVVGVIFICYGSARNKALK